MKNLQLLCKRIGNKIKVPLVFILIPLLTACNYTNDDEVSHESENRQGIAIPKSVQQLAINAGGTMNAYLYCDEIRHSMTITDDEVARGSCTGLSTTTLHTIRVDFEFTSDTFGGPFLIATATRESVSVGTNPIFEAGEFDTTIDDDGDQISNLVELEAGADPGDSSCFLGVSLIDHCTL